MEINTQTLTQIINLRKIRDWKVVIATKMKLYSLNKKDLTNLDKRRIYLLAKSLNIRKNNKQQSQDLSQKWMWGEYRLFIWVLIYYSQCLSIDACSIDLQSFKIIEELFPYKRKSFLLYQYYTSFSSSKNGRSVWNQEQLLLFQKLLTTKIDINQWKTISYEIFKSSDGRFFKTPQECRNRWANHNDPNLKKQPWTLQEDRQLINYIMSSGKKWSYIGKNICCGRTEHMTKNRYWWFINKYKINCKGLSSKQICLQILKHIGDKPPLESIQEQVIQPQQLSPGCQQQREIQNQGEQGQNEQNSTHTNNIGIFSSSSSIACQPIQLLNIDQIMRALEQKQLGNNFHFMDKEIIYHFEESQMEQNRFFIGIDHF